MKWMDRAREQTSRRGSLPAVALIVAAVLAVIVGLFLLRDSWPG